jgi:hypothetical protein
MRPSAIAALALLTACGSSGNSGSGFDPSDSGTQPAIDGATSNDASTPPTSDASFGSDDGGTHPTGGPSEVYGHSADTLYKLDPDTKAVNVVGPFKGCTSILDIALDKDSHLYGTTSTGLWSINRDSAQCSKIASGAYPNSLSFVPAGTLDPNVEALVGYEQGDYVRIDPVSGTKSTVGQIGGGLASSGDIVSVKGGGTYLTVKGPSCNDCLIEVNPATGAMVKNWGDVAHKDVFGLAFWAGKVYGFDDGGELFEVTFSASGTGITTAPIPIPNAPSGLQFWGAGSTTSAPVTPK